MPAGNAHDFCRHAIAGGVDLIQLNAGPDGDVSGTEVGQIRETCRREGALLVLDGDPVAALAADADGAHVSPEEVPIGYARSVLGNDRLIGLSSRTAGEAAMLLDLEPDYLLHHEGLACVGVFSGLHAGQTVLYAAGIESVEQAGSLVEAGVYRLAMDWSGSPTRDVGQEMTALSELLGRCL